MNLKSSTRRIINDVICFLYILLFIYASVSKLLDFENFQVQIGQSPLLSVYAGWMSWLVIFMEILIAVLLIFQSSRSIGLWAAFNLMLMFTIYIFIMLHYSSYVPCSCGGVLEKMTWDIHLIFNLVFVFLAGFALILNQDFSRNKTGLLNYSYKVLISLSVLTSLSVVVLLYINSERMMHYNNPFTRRYIKNSIQYVTSKNLKFNSYYFAGYNDHAVYLGNTTAPLRILSLDTFFKNGKDYKIAFTDSGIAFRRVRVVVQDKHFYLSDGTVPCVYKGDVSSWKTTHEFKGLPRFTSAVPMDSTKFAFRNYTGRNGSNIIGTYSDRDSSVINYEPALLESQIDGIFDTDGTLLYNQQLKNIIYVYYYRNEFIIADTNRNLLRKGNTIDTMSKAKIKVAKLKGGRQRKMAAPPLMVNARISTQGKFLFVQSKIRGFYESSDIWNAGVVIDVYDLKKKTYVLSFPIFGLHNGKFKSFMVTQTHLYAIFDSTLMIFRLKEQLIKDKLNIE